jgi:hypothetical protein
MSLDMASRELPQKPAIRHFKALLDSLDQHHDPEYHWLWNERRRTGQPRVDAAPEAPAEQLPGSAAQDPSPERNRRITDDRYDETA